MCHYVIVDVKLQAGVNDLDGDVGRCVERVERNLRGERALAKVKQGHRRRQVAARENSARP